jgi:hypothetical protein
MTKFRFFGQCTTKAEVDSLQRTLAKKLHPDAGKGNANEFAEMKAEYQAVCNFIAYGAWPPQQQQPAAPVYYIVQQQAPSPPKPTPFDRLLQVVEMIPENTRNAIISSVVTGFLSEIGSKATENHADPTE